MNTANKYLISNSGQHNLIYNGVPTKIDINITFSGNNITLNKTSSSEKNYISDFVNFIFLILLFNAQ